MNRINKNKFNTSCNLQFLTLSTIRFMSIVLILLSVFEKHEEQYFRQFTLNKNEK